MPNKLRVELAQPQLQKWARCSTSVFPKMFKFREKQSQVPPVLDNYNITLPLRTAAPPSFATVYNKLAGGGGGWCDSI
jgi:hypothetical protein